MALNRTNLKQTPIPVVPRTMQIVNSDGTVTRSGQLLLQQLQASDALQGTHDGRPDPSAAPDGALYVESDRLVLYSNIDGAWHYIAGTMWGSLSPDQRPTDLGVNDAGFDYRTTDQPAREFIWSQAAWIETTPVRYGTHAARLAVVVADVIEQMLWVETDRTVIYQTQGSAWHYVAGVMYGTLSPDQRPTDLGANDAGFQYRGTDQLRQFYWSGSAWVETTATTPQAQVAQATANLTLTNAFQPIPGASLTLTTPGRYLVIGCFDIQITSAADNNATVLGQAVIGGSALSGYAVLQGAGSATAATRATILQQWIYTLSGSAVSALLEAEKLGGGTGGSLAATQTTISAVWLGA